MLFVTTTLLLLFAGCSSKPPVEEPGMVFIDGGEFTMGTNDAFPFEGPEHRVFVDGFYMDVTEVTNRQFRDFVEATGYETESEKQESSGFFDADTGQWKLLDGADWRHPEGPGSNLEGKDDYPVIHVSWDDATAYAEWAGKRLPTEAEWEYAARGGLEGAVYPWGDALRPRGMHRANVWQGRFPVRDQSTDGFSGPAPVQRFAPNGYGLYDMAGNVWEWVADWYSSSYYRESPRKNPKGPVMGQEKINRGGSWLCSENYCQGYRVAARQKTARDSGLNNVGFRCVRDAS